MCKAQGDADGRHISTLTSYSTNLQMHKCLYLKALADCHHTHISFWILFCPSFYGKMSFLKLIIYFCKALCIYFVSKKQNCFLMSNIYWGGGARREGELGGCNVKKAARNSYFRTPHTPPHPPCQSPTYPVLYFPGCDADLSRSLA